MARTKLTLIEWRRLFENCEAWMDYVRQLHIEMGLPGDTLATPETLLRVATMMRKQCLDTSEVKRQLFLRDLKEATAENSTAK